MSVLRYEEHISEVLHCIIYLLGSLKMVNIIVVTTGFWMGGVTRSLFVICRFPFKELINHSIRLLMSYTGFNMPPDHNKSFLYD